MTKIKVIDFMISTTLLLITFSFEIIYYPKILFEFLYFKI